MIIGLGHYLSVAAIVFTLGVLGIFLNRKNVIIILMSIKLILLSVNINLVAFSTFLGDLVGQVYALVVLTVAAAEAAIGLAILVVYFRNRGSVHGEGIQSRTGPRARRARTRAPRMGTAIRPRSPQHWAPALPRSSPQRSCSFP